MAETICIKDGNVFFSDGGTIRKKDILISDAKIFRIISLDLGIPALEDSL